jgi:hypothetical protein
LSYPGSERAPYWILIITIRDVTNDLGAPKQGKKQEIKKTKTALVTYREMRPRRKVINAKNLKQQTFIRDYSMGDAICNPHQKSIRVINQG